MAYENYTQISWTDGSPLTGERLQQMSTNIQQIKEATDDSPQGVKRIKSVSTSSAQFTSFTTTNEIIALKDESSTGGVDNRVSIGASRYYRVVLNFTGIQVVAKGAEDSFYRVSIHEGTHGSANTTIYTADFTPPIYAFIDVATLGGSATIANIALRSNSFQSRFGAGVHSTIVTSDGSGFTNRSFFAAISRTQGQSQNNAPAYFVPANASTQLLQLYVEDVGGTA